MSFKLLDYVVMLKRVAWTCINLFCPGGEQINVIIHRAAALLACTDLTGCIIHYILKLTAEILCISLHLVKWVRSQLWQVNGSCA